MIRKEFSEDLYGQHDAAGKAVVKQFLKRCLIEAEENPDRYGVDLVAKNGYCYEVEVKNGWEGKDFPFPTLHIPERKGKWALPLHWFMVLNRDMDMLAVVKGWEVRDLIEKANKYVENGEQFYEVGLDHVYFYDLMEFLW